MGNWVLIVLLSGHGATVTPIGGFSAQFYNEAACKAAAEQYKLQRMVQSAVCWPTR